LAFEGVGVAFEGVGVGVRGVAWRGVQGYWCWRSGVDVVSALTLA
jgi:hypothetical protein